MLDATIDDGRGSANLVCEGSTLVKVTEEPYQNFKLALGYSVLPRNFGDKC